MTTKSIIQIGVEDDAFKAFLSLFQKYQEQLSQMPAQWEKIGQAMSESSTRFDKAIEALIQSSSAVSQLKEDEHKTAEDGDKFAKSTEEANKSVEKMHRTNKMLREDVSFTTKNLLTWVGIGAAFGSG